MPTIKTRDTIGRTVRGLNRMNNLSRWVKEPFIRSRQEQVNEKETASDILESGISEAAPHLLKHGVIRSKRINVKGKEDVFERSAETKTGAVNNTNSKIANPAKDVVNALPSEGTSVTGNSPSRTTVHFTTRAQKKYMDVKKVDMGRQAVVQKTVAEVRKANNISASSVKNALRRIWKELSQMITVLSSGSAAAVLMITVICFIGIIVASPYGIFLSKEHDGDTLVSAVKEISDEYYSRIEKIKSSVNYDDIEIRSNDGAYSIRWDEILSVYSVLATTDNVDPAEVVTMDNKKRRLLEALFKDMNQVGYSVNTETYEDTEILEDEEGNEIEITVEKIRTTLVLQLKHKSANEEATRYSFSETQLNYLNDLLSGKYATLWGTLLGGFSHGLGIIPTETTWTGIGRFIWPLPINGTITSGFGYRTDPFTGETKFHGGLDIAADAGTPIIAADDGIITVANGVDSWGGGYGFYVMISHGDGYETLYGHCSSICVSNGQVVQKGEVIAYVGSTGNSTGNHLHFEIRANGQKQDPLKWYQ